MLFKDKIVENPFQQERNIKFNQCKNFLIGKVTILIYKVLNKFTKEIISAKFTVRVLLGSNKFWFFFLIVIFISQNCDERTDQKI